MSDSEYIFMKGVIKRLEERLAAARAFVASYENGEDHPPLSATDFQYENASPPKPNGHIEIRFPQVASGKRLRPGALKHDVIRGAFDLLVSQTPLRKVVHKREIVNYLSEKGVLEHIDIGDRMSRVSVILSQSKGILDCDGSGNWFIDPALIPPEYQEARST
jgi:hypothetical protein